MRKFTRVAAYGFIVQDQKILLCRLSSMEKDVGHWTLPGGGIDFGESPHDGAIREIREETGLEARIIELVTVDSKLFAVADYEMHAVRIFYRAEPVGGSLCVEVDGSTDGCAWFTEEEARELPLVDIAQFAVDSVFERTVAAS